MKKLEQKVILVTGAAGFIGSHLVTRLSKIPGVKLLLFSRQARPFAHQNSLWLNGELGQLTPEYWHSHGISQIDNVFHFGGFTPKSELEANLINNTIKDNILGTSKLLLSFPGKIEKLVFSSTLDVYSRPENGVVLTEDSAIKPASLYGLSKLFCEQMVSVWAKEKGCDCSILRFGHIYGPGEEKYLKLIPIVIRALLENQSPVIFGDGSALRDYLYVADAVEATVRACLLEKDSGILNIVSGTSVTLKEIVELIIELAGKKIEIRYKKEKPNGTSFRFDNHMMTSFLGNWPLIGLKDGLAAEIATFSGSR
ncbi:MAG: NAD-dependent epimerase/dehydratase family protein [Chloroflexota bacterium]